MLIWDTGASFGLTPFRSDIDYVKCEIPVRDVTKVNKVIGIGVGPQIRKRSLALMGSPIYK